MGSKFFYGSSSDLIARRSYHWTRLKAGIHENQELMAAFLETDAFSFHVVEPVERFDSEPQHAFAARIKDAEQAVLESDGYGVEGCCNIHPDDRDRSMRLLCNRKRRDEEDYAELAWREKALAMMRFHVDVDEEDESAPVSWQEKTGAQHSQARPFVMVMPKGETRRFRCLSAAAKELGVTKAAVSGWLNGKTPWPGEGKRVRFPKLVGLVGYWE